MPENMEIRIGHEEVAHVLAIENEVFKQFDKNAPERLVVVDGMKEIDIRRLAIDN